ncbi:MAG: hypothetical protein JXB49_10885 [Bacteroidales bacterium]|nr:hypothetical protein [Bacteroidales bacterium]
MKNLQKPVLSTLVFSICLLSNINCQIIYVDSSATGTNTGDSWANAYYHIQTAFDNFSPGDTIWVANGTYYPVADRDGVITFIDQFKTFSLPDKCVMYGGFSGSETSLEERDWMKNPVILSGDNGTKGVYGDNSFNVVFNGDTGYIDGFVILYGYAMLDLNTDYGYGGGIYNEGQLYLKNCILSDNKALFGGGIYCDANASLFMENTIVANNNADYTGWGPSGYGGGIGYESTNPFEIINCTFYGNTSWFGYTSAIESWVTTPSLINCIIWDNRIDKGVLSYCCMADSTTNGNIGTDPMLADPNNDNFSLQRESPCINKGNPASPNDPDGTRADIGAIPFEHDTIDLGIIEFNFLKKEKLSGNQDVTITIKNYGTENITSVDIGWSVDGVLQTPASWAGNLGLYEWEDSILLGAFNFSHEFHTLETWLISPNGKADEYPANDTLIKIQFFCDSIMGGTYTIGATGKYPGFNDAIDAMCNCGINAPVNFEVEDGFYQEQITIYPVPGASATDTIVFSSASGENQDVILSYQPVVETQPYTLLLDSADYITFKDITIVTNGRSFGRAAGFLHGASNNNLLGNIVVGDDTTSILIYCNSDGGIGSSHVTIKENKILGGLFGIYWTDYNNSYTYNDYLTVEDNYMNNFIYLSYHRYTKIKNNYIDIAGDNSSASEIFRSISSNELTIERNRFYKRNGPGNIAILIAGSNQSLKMVNNFILGNDHYLVYVFNGNPNLDIYYNTIYNTSMETGIALNLTDAGPDLYNNNFITLSKDPAVSFPGSPTGNSNNNNIYSAGKYIIKAGSTGYTTLGEWNAATGRDANSVSAFTGFLADTNLYTFVNILDSAGISTTGVNVDIEGKPRNVNYPDIGATEFVAALPASGTFIVGASPAAVKPTLRAMIDSLALTGIKGPVEILMEPGIYEEQVIIPQIYGLTDSTRLKITSQNGDSSSVILSHNHDTYKGFILCLNGADYVDIEKLTFNALNTDYSKNIYINNYANYNSFTNNIFYAPQNISWRDEDALILCSAASQHGNLFQNNLLTNGRSGISFIKKSGSIDQDISVVPDIRITGNHFIDQYYCGIFNDKFNPFISDGNYFTSEGRYLDYAAFYLSDIPFSGTKIMNNIIDINTRFPIRTFNCDTMDVLHNSIRMQDCYGPQFSNTPVRMMNNIIANGTDRSLLEVSDTSQLNENFNMYYTPNWDFEARKIALGLGDSSFYADPKFTGDLVLVPQSVLPSNVGAPLLDVLYDYSGTLRGSRPDLGAVEIANPVYALDDIYECGYNIAELDAGEGFDTYHWSNDSVTRLIHIDTAGIGLGSEIYSVDVTFRGNSYSDDFTLYFSIPTVNLGEDIIACQGDSIILDAGNKGHTYKWWYDYDHWILGSERYLVVKGSYEKLAAVAYDTIAGCEDSDTIKILFNPHPNYASMYLMDGYLEVISNFEENVDSVIWYHNNVLIKRTALDKSNGLPYRDTLTFEPQGIYRAEVINSFGCIFTLEYNTTDIDISKIKGQRFILFPIPTKDNLNVLSNIDGNFEFKLISLDGKTVLEKSRYIHNGVNELFNISHLNTGTYLLYIEGKGNVDILEFCIE